ncbi:MAG: hypothetical protein ABI724_09765 [Betaproteobacteria bacterium]
MKRLARELTCLWEFWLLPIAVALLPYRAGVALARWCARSLPLYDERARAGLAQFRAARPMGDSASWLAEFRFTQLVDHADLFWALTRRERFLLARLDASLPEGAPPLMVISMHFGQGLWLLPWLRAGGMPARFLSVRFTASAFESRMNYLYARLRMRVVERLAGVPAIYTGGARGEIGATLSQPGCVYGLIDVPSGAVDVPNGALFGTPVFWPPGLVDVARAASADVMLLTARCAADGRRCVVAERLPTLDVAAIVASFGARIEAAPGAWHVWHFMPAYAVSAMELGALQ